MKYITDRCFAKRQQRYIGIYVNIVIWKTNQRPYLSPKAGMKKQPTAAPVNASAPNKPTNDFGAQYKSKS